MLKEVFSSFLKHFPASEANNAVSNLNNYVDGAFADGVISEAEASAIEKYINTVKMQKQL